MDYDLNRQFHFIWTASCGLLLFLSPVSLGAVTAQAGAPKPITFARAHGGGGGGQRSFGNRMTWRAIGKHLLGLSN